MVFLVYLFSSWFHRSTEKSSGSHGSYFKISHCRDMLKNYYTSQKDHCQGSKDFGELRVIIQAAYLKLKKRSGSWSAGRMCVALSIRSILWYMCGCVCTQHQWENHHKELVRSLEKLSSLSQSDMIRSKNVLLWAHSQQQVSLNHDNINYSRTWSLSRMFLSCQSLVGCQITCGLSPACTLAEMSRALEMSSNGT